VVILNAKKIKVEFEKGKMKVTRRAELVIRFDIPEDEAMQEFLDAIVGEIKREIKKDFGTSSEVEANWL